MSDETDAAYLNGVEHGRIETLAAVKPLLERAGRLVEMLDDAEVNHGSLVGTVTMRARDELRQELFRWRTK